MPPKRSHRAASAAHKNLAEPGGADSWDDSDEEKQPKPARAGAKRKAPRAAVGDADGAPQPAKQRRIKQAVDVHDLTLLEIIFSHSSALDTAVKEWVERYRANRAAATAELMTLLVKACGADDELTEEDVEGGEVDSIAQRLTQMVHEEGGVNLFAHTRQAKAFTGHYCLFWDKLLRALAQAELLFDDFELNDKLTRLVTALNISVVRPFRHAATLTAAQLVSSWIAVSKGLADSRNLTQAQLDAEERKKGKAHNQQVINGLRRTLERTHARVEDLRNFRGVVFSGVFSHRFRDVSAEIRAIVIEAIGGWVEALPSEFLSDSYLKYLAWALSDRETVVRLQAIKALTTMYSHSDNVPRLQEFTARFTSRFCELMHDVSEDVAAAGLRLLAVLVQQNVVTHKDVSGVFMLLAMPNAELRSSAAVVVVNLLGEQGREALEAAAERLKAAAAASAAPGAPATKAKGRGSKSKAQQQSAATAAGGGSGAAAAAAAAAAMLEDDDRLQLAGLLAVMGKLAAAEPLDGSSISTGELKASVQLSEANIRSPSTAAVDGSSSSGLPTLPQEVVAKLLEALWTPMYSVLSDVRGLTSCLADESAVELWGKVGTAHLSSLLTAAAHMHIYGGGGRVGAAGRKAKLARSKAAAAAAGGAAAAADEEAQQEVTVLMMQQLPALLTMYQAEPVVVAPLLALPRMLRLDLYLLRGASETYRSLLTQVDGLMQRHQQQQLIVEASGAMVYASKAGPEALQEVGRQVLATASTTAAQKLSAAAAAVSKLTEPQLAEGVADLAESPEDAPDALLSLLTGARRVHVLLSAGSTSLAKDSQLGKTCQTLLRQCMEGRELGPELTSLLLHITNLRLMWQLGAAVAAEGGSSTAAVNAYVQQRSSFAKVLEWLLESGGTEQLTTPEQQLAAQWWHSNSNGRYDSQGLDSSSQQVLPAELAEQLSVGIHTLQDLAFLQLTELLWLENCNAGLAEQQQHLGGGRRGVPGGFGQMSVSAAVLDRLWRYCCGVLEREAPEVPEAPAAGGAGEEEDGIEEDPDDIFDDYDTQGAVARRAARAAARREALAAAGVSLEALKQRVLMALFRLLAYTALPGPGFNWLLSRVISLLDGYGTQASTATRSLLVHLKSTSRDGGLVSHLVEGLTLLYDTALEAHGEEGAPAAAAGVHRNADRQDPTSWAHVASVSSKLAGIFQGHNLSQLVLGSLLDKGLAWTLDEPLSRSAFPLVCLGPFLSKLSATEAERVAGALQGRLAEAGVGQEDEGAAQQLEDFLGHLQACAAGKKVTRGVLKTPNRATAAAANAAADAGDGNDDDTAAAADVTAAGVTAAATGRKSTGKGGRRKGSRIRFAADVDPEYAAASDAEDRSPPTAAAAARGSSRGGRGSAGGSDGWITKQKGSSSPGSNAGSRGAAAGRQQQQQRGRAQRPTRQQQQQSVGSHLTDEEIEDAVEGEDEEEQQQQQPKGRRGGRQAAAAAGQSQGQGRSSRGRRQQHQQQQQQQQEDSCAAAASEDDDAGEVSDGSDDAAAAADAEGLVGSLLANSEGDAGYMVFSVEELPLLTRPNRSRGAQQQQQQQQRGRRGAAPAAAAAGESGEKEDAEMLDADSHQEQDAYGSLQANSEDVQEEGYDLLGGDGSDNEDFDPAGSLPSLQVVLDDVPDDYGEVVDEPPPTRRFGRRR